MAIPSLYRFFADRAEILDALLEHMTADLDQHARAAEAARRPRRPHRLELDTAAAYFEAHPSAVALWFGGRVSPPVVQTIRARNHALAVGIRTLLISHHLVPEQTPLAAVDLLVELGDRILEVAFRSPGPPTAKRSSSAASRSPPSRNGGSRPRPGTSQTEDAIRQGQMVYSRNRQRATST